MALPGGDYWTAISAVIVAAIGGWVTYAAAKLHLKNRGITPSEAGQLINRKVYRSKLDESVAMAVELAHSANEAAAKAEREAAEAKEEITRLGHENRKVRGENLALRDRVTALEVTVRRVGSLETQIRKCRETIRAYEAAIRRRKRK